MSLTLEQLEDAYAKLATGQHVVNFRSPNGKSVTYSQGDMPTLLGMINRMKRKQGQTLTRTRRVITSKGL
tara:strand:+ start:611 stop:820 length:210 start_codon:yes stop_codon:yes gene_type:complete